MKFDQQEYFQIITEASHDAIIIIDDKGEITFWNRSAEKILGYPRNEIVGRNLHEMMVSKSFHKSHEAGFSEFIKTGKGNVVNQTVEVEAIHKEGRIIHVELSISGLKQGGNWHALGILRDITERKEKEAMLLESESRFRLMADSTPVMIWSTGTDAFYDYFNKSWLSFTGKTLEKELGNGWTDGVHPDDKERCFEIYNNSFRDRSVFRMEYRRKNADDTYQWLLDIGAPRLTDNGMFMGFIGSCVDISVRMEKELKINSQNEEMAKSAAELVIASKELLFQNDEKAKRAAELLIANKELLFQNEEKEKRAAELVIANKLNHSNELIAFERDRLQKIASLVPGVVYQFRMRPDGSLSFPYASDAIEALFQVTPEEVREDGSKAFAIIHSDDRDKFDHSILQSAKDLSPQQVNFRVKLNDGSIHHLFGNSLPHLEADGSVLWYGFITDITEQKEKEQKIGIQNIELQKLIAKQNKLFSIIAHDLRSPFNGLLGLTELMADATEDISLEKMRTFSSALNKSAHHTFDLLENLLTWCRSERGLLECRPQSFALCKTIQESTVVLGEQAQNKSIEIKLDIDVDMSIIADLFMFQTIVRNLTSNAIKFTKNGGNIEISALLIDHFIQISIKDTGIGMSEEIQNNLFRIDADTKRPGTAGELSTGLGLLLCRDFVVQMGGEISIESRVNEGSTFRFTLPAN